MRWWLSRQVIDLGQQLLIGALRRVGRFLLDQIAFHPVDMVLGLDPVVAAEQPRQARVADRDVQAVRIIVGDGLPVERARTKRDPADRPQILETIGRDLVLIRRHHLGDRRRAGLERDEQEAAPILQRDREQAELLGLQARIFVAVRNADEPPVARIAPRMIGAGQDLGAAARAVDQPRSAMAADVGEGADLADRRRG